MGCQVLLGGKRKKKSDTNSDNNTKRDGRQQTSRVCLFLQFSFTALNSATPLQPLPPRPLQLPRVKTFLFKWFPLEQRSLLQKRDKRRKNAFQSCWFRLYNNKMLHVKKTRQAGRAGNRPEALLVCGQQVRAGLSTTYTPPRPPPDPQGNVTHSLKLSGRGRGKKDEAKSRRRKR